MADHFFSRLPLSRRVPLRLLWGLGRAGLGPQLTPLFLRVMASDIRKAHRTGWGSYQPTADDIIVCTYPKSGTNWVMQILLQALGGGAAEFAHIHDVVPWPDAPLPTVPRSLLARAGKRVIKTHTEQPGVPWADSARYVVVICDPRDVFVSSYHFSLGVMSGIFPPRLSPSDWLQNFLGPVPLLGCWAEHTASWWPLRARPNVLVLTFRQLKADLPGVLTRLCDFVGVSLSPAERRAVLERSGFRWMKQHEERFSPPIPVLRDRGGQMIRSGRVGERGLLGDTDFDRIRRHFVERLAARGCDFPYTEHFPSS